MAYLKPQKPLHDKESDNFIYPLTTVDQVIMEDGTRLNAEMSKHLTVDIEGSNEADPNTVNADTLGGYAADEYVKAILTNTLDVDKSGYVIDAKALKIILDEIMPKKLDYIDLLEDVPGLDLIECEIIKVAGCIKGKITFRALTDGDNNTLTFDSHIINIISCNTDIPGLDISGITIFGPYKFYMNSNNIYIILDEDYTIVPGDYTAIF